MTKMHDNEFIITEDLIYSLLHDQCPEWAHLPLKPIISSGTDNALFRLGNDLVIRLPRIEWYPGSIEQSINKEYLWLPKLAKFLKIPISEPIFKGQPNASYPWDWLITKWNDGCHASFEQENEYELLANDLALFLNQLHAVKLPNGPASRRGVMLKEIDIEIKDAIHKLEAEINIELVSNLWNELLEIPYWNKEFVWIHGDFLPGNILVKENRLCAVIDFSDLGMGDPACDLIIAWSLFNSHSRKIFRNKLINIDDDTWQRGRGWALSIALIMLPYYKHTNPALVSLAKRMIENVLGES